MHCFPKGTRKNNITGNCDKTDGKKRKLTEKLHHRKKQIQRINCY